MKEKIGKKGIKKRLFRAVLALAMVVALLPMNIITAEAAEYKSECVWQFGGQWKYQTCGDPVKLGDILTKCRCYEEDTSTWKVYLDGSRKLKGDKYTIYGTVVKIDTNLYVCSSSTHESNKDASGLCPTCKLPHAHDWQYSATNNKLEAYCANENCPSETSATNKVSLTLSATSPNYSGSAYTGASITGLDAFKTATGLTTEPTITYWKVTTAGATAGGTEKTAAEVGQTVGYYYAKISVNGYDAVKAFTVGDDSAKSQPKTGVMDTLPMWFGVMAVSAAAYVLTSKKRFF